MIEQSSAPVSVVVPYFQSCLTIDRAIASIFHQTWRPFEVLLIDDVSADGSLDYLDALSSNYPKDWLKIYTLKSNQGPGTARNFGWHHATQQYIAFLDADDMWHPQKIELQCSWMIQNPNVALSGHGASVVTDKDPDILEVRVEGMAWHKSNSTHLLLTNGFATSTVMLKSNLAQRFADKKYHSEDYLLWCEISLDGHELFRTKTVLAYAFKPPYGRGGLTANLSDMARGERDTYAKLFQSGRIKVWIYPFLQFISAVKYLRRILIIKKGRPLVSSHPMDSG